MTEDVIYLTEDFEPVDKDDPRMFMVKVRFPDGSIVFGFPEEKEKEAVQNKLFHHGGPGSGFHDHEGRPGQVGGSSSDGGSSMQRPTDKQIQSALQMGIYQVSNGAHIPLEKVKYSVELVPVNSLIASENKKPSQELISIYKQGKQIQPISVRKVPHERKMKVLDGNHRLKAARLAGVESVWVVGIEDW